MGDVLHSLVPKHSRLFCTSRGLISLEWLIRNQERMEVTELNDGDSFSDWNPKRKLGVTTYSSEIIKLQFWDKNDIHFCIFESFLQILLLNYF